MLNLLAPNVWEIPTIVRLMPAVHVPTRCVVVRLGNGELWMHSPVALDQNTIEAINALGPVTSLVAPSLYHHLFLAPAAATWPAATRYHAPGLPQKRPDLACLESSQELGAHSQWHQGEITSFPILGVPSINETAFYHAPTKSLIVTDLVIHIVKHQGALSSFVMGTLGGAKPGRFSMGRLFDYSRKDKKAVRRSLLPLLELPLERVIMAHGAPVTLHDTEPLKRALAPGFS